MRDELECNCGSTDWKFILHGDTTTGGLWRYICGKCGEYAITLEYSETGFGEMGRANPYSSKESANK